MLKAQMKLPDLISMLFLYISSILKLIFLSDLHTTHFWIAMWKTNRILGKILRWIPYLNMCGIHLINTSLSKCLSALVLVCLANAQSKFGFFNISSKNYEFFHIYSARVTFFGRFALSIVRTLLVQQCFMFIFPGMKMHMLETKTP